MPRISIPLVATFVLLAGLATVAPTGAEEATSPPCEGFQVVPFQGPSCPIDGGWRVLLADGSSVETHGPDRADGKSSPGGGPAKAAAVACVADPTRQFHNVVVYAYASDKPDRSAEMAPVLRGMVEEANGFLRQESMELGAAARYKFRCEGVNVVTVLGVRLPRADADVTFATIISDLRAQGLNSPYAKHWVWYDGTRGPLYGQAQIFSNDKLTSANGNARGNMFSVVYGLTDPMAFVHESAHTMGAIQKTAPHGTQGFHCTDGLDVMCYDDGTGAAYDATACTDRVHFDCNHDDYFHPSPAPGSWLATHWNVAHPYNRFLDFGRANAAPVVQPIVCVPAIVDYDEPATCKVIVDDDSDGVSYQVSVDGAPAARHPATGWLIAGNALTLTYRWSALGEHAVTATATDDAKKPLTSAPVTGVVRVGCAFERAGNLTAGLAGTPDDTSAAWEQGVPRACAGLSFHLGATLGADADLCWHADEDALLGCSEALGAESGTVPAGARAARVYLKAGASAAYTLRAG